MPVKSAVAICLRSLTVAALIACLGWAGEARAWSAAGHETVGAIADGLIAGGPTATAVYAVLGMDLRTASLWADCVKGVSQQEGTLHYSVGGRYRECRPFEDAAGQARMVDYVRRNPDHKQYHYTDVAILRDRYLPGEVGTSDHDIVAALGAAIRVLQGAAAPAPFSIKDRQEALFLVAHFVGDLGQPLHVGAVYLDPSGRVIDPDHGAFDPATETRGGNQLLDGHRVLHAEWDDIAEELAPARFAGSGAAQARDVPTTAGPAALWPTIWASDTLQASRAVFQGVVFGEENAERHTWGVSLPAGYTERREELQRRQLVKAGARLAKLMQTLFP
jgi:hypothetical protein